MNSLALEPSLQSMRCSICGLSNDLKSCSGCNSVYYCSREHQKLDWSSHKIICKQMNQSARANAVNHLMLTNANIVGHNYEVQTTSTINPILNSTIGSNVHMSANGANSGQNSINNCTSNNGFQLINNIVIQSNHLNVRHDLISTELFNNYCESIVNDLNECGFCVIDNFLNPTDGLIIRSDVINIYNSGVLTPGQVANASATSSAHLYRGDHVLWVLGNEHFCPNIGVLIQTLDRIVMRSNVLRTEGQLSKYKITRRTKAMVACYPGNNSQYVKHVDNPNKDGRCITCIYYLNKDYNKERDGGVLRIFPVNSSCMAEIEPQFNRVIFFWSDNRNPHEVMPALRLRFAITVWYYDDIEKEEAMRRARQQQALQFPVHNHNHSHSHSHTHSHNQMSTY